MDNVEHGMGKIFLFTEHDVLFSLAKFPFTSFYGREYFVVIGVIK